LDKEGASRHAALAVSLATGNGRIWGMTSAERLRRTFQRAGLRTIARDALERAPGVEGVVLARADWIYDENLIRGLAQRPGAVLTGPGGAAAAAHVRGDQAQSAAAALERGEDPAASVPGLTRLDPGELAYNEALRKREAPILEPFGPAPVDRAQARRVEARLFQGSYKGVTDLVTKHLWPRPARIVTRWCALAGVTPNTVTFVGLLLVIAAFALFWTGHFGWGLACGWMMTFLDTVDGKLARVTLTSSRIGNVFDHGIDLIHPPFWWWAWFVGVQHDAHPLPWPSAVLAIVTVGYVAQRVEEGVFLRAFKLQMHAWRRFDSWFRLITARRNPNLILLTAATLVGRPDVGLAAVAVWTVASFLVHLVQLIQAFAAPRAQVTSWLAG
jgi:phosphatidylglycerophosphate synthase